MSRQNKPTPEGSDDGWTAISQELPPVGQRVEVRHILNPSYDCKGELRPDGGWSCENAFILPNMMLAWEPTHWRPAAIKSRLSA